MQYTPGPWIVNDDCIEAQGPEGPRDVTIAVMHSPLRERHGNARLIANAPSLVERLEECADWLGRLSNCTASDRCVDAARALLHHVQGGTNGQTQE